MKKGFTLLELIVVIVIIGILATLGFAQYSQMIEKSRGAEAKSIIGAIRTNASAHYVQYGALNVAPIFTTALAGIGASPLIAGPAAGNCNGNYYFWYNFPAPGAATITVTATRCAAGGKTPNGTAVPAGTVVLATDFAAGFDTFTATGGY